MKLKCVPMFYTVIFFTLIFTLSNGVLAHSVTDKNNKIQKNIKKVKQTKIKMSFHPVNDSMHVDVSDLDMDGNVDLIMYWRDMQVDSYISIFYGSKKGVFYEHSQRFRGRGVYDYIDINNDGQLDLVNHLYNKLTGTAGGAGTAIVSDKKRNYGGEIIYEEPKVNVYYDHYPYGLGTIYKIDSSNIYDSVLGTVPYTLPSDLNKNAKYPTFANENILSLDADGNGYTDLLFTFKIPPTFGRESIDKTIEFSRVLYTFKDSSTKWGPVLKIDSSAGEVFVLPGSKKMLLHNGYTGTLCDLFINKCSNLIAGGYPIIDLNGKYLGTLKLISTSKTSSDSNILVLEHY